MSNDNSRRPDAGSGAVDDATAELLGRALHDEAATVQTEPAALQAIQQRTAGSAGSAGSHRSRRSWVYAGLGAAAATAAVIAVVAVVGDNAADHATGPTTGTDKTVQDGQDQQLPPVGVTVDVVLPALGTAEEGYRLHSEARSVPVPDGEDGRISALRAFLREGPIDPDYSTGWPDDLDVGGIDPGTGGAIHVDLTGPGATIDPDAALTPEGRALAVQAMFRAAGGHPGDTATLTYNGTDLDSVFGVALPVTIESDTDSLAWINISSPVDQADVTAPVSVTVSGNVFEGNVNWELVDGNGDKVKSGFATTSMGMWTDATIKLGALDPGTYTIRCFEVSPENGAVGNLDDKTFTVE